MNRISRLALTVLVALAAGLPAFAQASIKAALKDATTGDPVDYATVSITRKGQTKPYKYVLSSGDGTLTIESVRKGTYTFKAEQMGYLPYTQEVTVEDKTIDLGTVKMKIDAEQLDAASVSAVGNPIIIKKDTIEFNASSFKTTDNDVLEDLLKKLPGVEVSEDGSITVNGETVSKIYIDGKTFFLDDPQLASKNIPAKIVNKLKVIEKKSDQAEFTGIDDGEEETVIDLSIKPGMMKGWFGNVSAGAGHDVPSSEVEGDYRYQGAAFVGRFTDKSQISIIANVNNTNNRGFNDLAGSMMQGMRGGGGGMGRGQGGMGGGNGITTSYMGGVNGAVDLFGGDMELNGNYLYNHSNKDVSEQSYKETTAGDQTLLYNSDGSSNTASGGHRFGLRLEHKFSENTSIIFEPQVNFGTGSYWEQNATSTDTRVGSSVSKTNEGTTYNDGANKNVSTSGFFLLRQRLGIPGRTLTAHIHYSLSNNDLTGVNKSTTYSDYNTTAGTWNDASVIDQNFTNNQKSTSINGRVTYTEPLGNHFYVEGNYSYNWSRSTSEKETFDTPTGLKDYNYSNSIINESGRHEAGANLMYQNENFRAQAGVSIQPTHTYNSTTQYNSVDDTYVPREYVSDVVNWSPQLMLWGDFSEDMNGRLFYHGRSSQPGTSQLNPVPDNTDPLNISFGNPSLKPYFSHDIRGDVRYNNKQTFASFNVRFNGGFVQTPIVNAIWYGSNGATYSMPVNGPTSASAGLDGFLNLPIAKSNWSISNMARASWSKSSSYVGTDVDMTGFPDPLTDYYDFMEQFQAKYTDLSSAADFTCNVTQTIGVTERLRVTYKNDDLELTLSGRTRMSHSWYTMESLSNLTTWNNQVRATATWTWDATGIGLKSEFNYNWYDGYTTEQPSEYVLNAEITKLLFKNKVTLSLKGYDILGQSKNLTVTTADNTYTESINNTLGRYIVLSLTYRFGTFNRDNMRGPHGGPGGPGGPPPM